MMRTKAESLAKLKAIGLLYARAASFVIYLYGRIGFAGRGTELRVMELSFFFGESERPKPDGGRVINRQEVVAVAMPPRLSLRVNCKHKFHPRPADYFAKPNRADSGNAGRC